MLPQFPQFKQIELSDKENIEQITRQYPPYSDFNFVSMYSWDVKGEMRVSELNGNIVIRFNDYITGKPFYSFLGKNKPNETAEALLELSVKEGLEAQLKLIPHDSILELDNTKFKIEPDRDHFDYILDTKKLTERFDKKIRYHSNLSNRLLEESKDKIRINILDLSIKEQRDEVLNLTNTWILNKTSSSENNKEHVSSLELDVISRFFLLDGKDNLSLGIFYNNKLIGCSINNILDNDFSLCHFMKADNVFKGIYSCLFIETARIMLENGKKYINIEQDLGIANLRQSKQSFEPVDFLKKYVVTLV